MTQIRFRPVDSITEQPVKRIIIDGLAEHFGRYDGSFNPDLTDLLDFYARPDRQLLVGILDDEVVCAGGLIREDEETGRIVRMSVAREHRGRGLGARMVKELEQRARAFGYHTIVLETNNDWHAALALYSRCGYLVIRRDDESTHFAKALDHE